MKQTELYFAIQNIGTFIALGLVAVVVLCNLIVIAACKWDDWRYKRNQKKNKRK